MQLPFGKKNNGITAPQSKRPRKASQQSVSQGSFTEGYQAVRGDYEGAAQYDAAQAEAAQGTAGQAGQGVAGQAQAALPARGESAADRFRRKRGDKAPKKQKKPSRMGQIIGNWWNRLISAVYSGSLSDQTEQYAAHNTTRDYLWNSIGLGAWGCVFPILSIVTTQLLGAEDGGRFSMAFVTGTMLLYIANYGVRTYQVSDLAEKHSFWDYQINRFITCAAMMLIGILYCQLRSYDASMFTMCMGMFMYRAIDGLADVYEGRLQQVDKLYLAGISQAVRSAAVIVAYSILLLISHSIAVAGIAMGVASVASLILLTIPLTLFESPKSSPMSIVGIKDLFVECFPLFLALFLYNLIDNMPKFSMEGVLPYSDQLYFNALFSPAHIIIMVIGFVYKPQLMRLAEIWADTSRRKRFDLIILAIMALIVGLTGLVALFMGTIGIPIMSFLYGVDFEQFRGLAYVMVVTGGVCAAIDFLYQVITVLRRQKAVTRVYLLTLGFSLFIPPLLIGFTGLTGAVLGYLIVMCILFVLLVTEYLSIHAELNITLPNQRKRVTPEE